MSWNQPSRNPYLESKFMVPEIRTIIADDENLARQKLRILLAAEPGLRIVAECKNGRETLEALQAYRPDMLMLDVQMPDVDGFELLKCVPSEQMPIVIFTTAYDQYAIRAFEAHALDYLLKPFDHERLREALHRARLAVRTQSERVLTNRLLTLLQGNQPASSDRRFLLRSGGRVVFLAYDE